MEFCDGVQFWQEDVAFNTVIHVSSTLVQGDNIPLLVGGDMAFVHAR